MDSQQPFQRQKFIVKITTPSPFKQSEEPLNLSPVVVRASDFATDRPSVKMRQIQFKGPPRSDVKERYYLEKALPPRGNPRLAPILIRRKRMLSQSKEPPLQFESLE